VVSLRRGVDDDVVDVDGAQVAAFLQEEVHGALEGRVAEAEGHATKLE